ncbi:MAG: hypothetical protein F6K00_17970 [Leptolyngbya sp. SIOISBB]|nr:hypothetical protein [Leptolyngbya sp. SIOISBB]
MISSTGPERDFEHAQLLMQEYSFDLGRFNASELVALWHERLQAEPSWIRAAVLEALYLGRYKAFSVEQILQGWKRRSHPVRHFNSEFERAVFSPIDPTISQYAAMTALAPYDLMSPQVDGGQNANSLPSQSEAVLNSADMVHSEPSSLEAIASTTSTEPLPSTTEAEPQPPELLTSVTETSTPGNPDLTSLVDKAGADPDYAASLFREPEPIQQFTPAPEPSEFYQRLQAVARHSES